jgi:NADPH:quinone reductase-like Zn-dependent oxidoreductase
LEVSYFLTTFSICFYRQVIQLAKHWGIKTINVVRRVEQKEELKSLGADEVICSTTEGETSEIHALA